MRYHLDYPRVRIPRIKNIYTPQDTGTKVEFIMLPFIMFDSTPVLRHGNIFEPSKRYIAPHACTKKERRKRSILSLFKNKKRERRDII